MKWRALLARLALGLVLAGAIAWAALHRDRFDPALIEAWIRDLGIWGPLAFVALYALAAVLFVPGSLLSLVGGALFGPFWGALINLVGATLGATVSFLISRSLGSSWVRRMAGPRLQRVIAGVEAEGWRFVALVRLVPLFPFNLTNYTLGLTRIPLAHYVLATFVCMAPGALAYAWLGHAGRAALSGDADAIRYGLLALALIAAIAFLPRLVGRFRAERPPRWIDVDELAGASDSLAVIDVRTEEEFIGSLGHIAGARNLPLAEMQGSPPEITGEKDRPLVLVCRTDKRSAKAAALLNQAGFSDVRVLRGGMELWRERGLPVELATEAANDAR